MPDPAFVDRLNQQIGYEFGASQQYVAAAVHYDNETLPRLAAFFYAQALEERNHAMMMVQYLMDADADVVIPGIEAPRSKFADIVEPVRVALEQEKRVSAQINELAALAREHGDYSSARARTRCSPRTSSRASAPRPRARTRPRPPRPAARCRTPYAASPAPTGRWKWYEAMRRPELK
jgi:ferritin